MSALASGWISLEKLKEIVKVVEAKGEKGFKFTASINDKSQEFTSNGKTTYQNVSYYAEQTKEQQTAKSPKYYFANGNVFWTDGKIVKAGPGTAPAQNTQQAAPQSSGPSIDDLPF